MRTATHRFATTAAAASSHLRKLPPSANPSKLFPKPHRISHVRVLISPIASLVGNRAAADTPPRPRRCRTLESSLFPILCIASPSLSGTTNQLVVRPIALQDRMLTPPCLAAGELPSAGKGIDVICEGMVMNLGT
jgi:hypothetical protein